MKRIVLLICAALLLVANTAEARLFRRSSGRTTYTQYTQATYTQATYTQASNTQASNTQATASPSAYSTATAQGVAQIMAAYGRVGHWGGNSGYEGCGCGVSPAAAYNSCCYANSGMATVDVGYAQGASGMWFCCRRYR